MDSHALSSKLNDLKNVIASGQKSPNIHDKFDKLWNFDELIKIINKVIFHFIL